MNCWVFGYFTFLFFMGSADWSRSALVYSQRKHPKQAVFKKQKKLRANDFLSFF